MHLLALAHLCLQWHMCEHVLRHANEGTCIQERTFEHDRVAYVKCLQNVDGFIPILYDTLETQLCIDTTREYAAGESNGGMQTYQLGVDLAHRERGFRPYCIAPRSAVSNRPVTTRLHKLPVLIFVTHASTAQQWAPTPVLLLRVRLHARTAQVRNPHVTAAGLAAIAPQFGSFQRGWNLAPKDGVAVLDLHGTRDTVIPANFSLSGEGFYYTPVPEIFYGNKYTIPAAIAHAAQPRCDFSRARFRACPQALHWMDSREQVLRRAQALADALRQLREILVAVSRVL